MTTVNLRQEHAVISQNRSWMKNYEVIYDGKENDCETSEKTWFGIPKVLWTWCAVLVIITGAFLIITECRLLTATSSSAPNYVLIVLDDLGWKDISSHGSKLPTPNIDSLIEEGVEFSNFHGGTICTPARAALMTGRFAFRLGMQNEVALNDYMRVHIPSNELTYAEWLVQEGYENHFVGKWHLGFASWQWTPLYRGWTSFVGYFLGEIDYLTHMFSRYGHDSYLDFWENYNPFWEANNTWSDDVFFNSWMEVFRNPGRPFTLTWAAQSPHSPDDEFPEDISDVEEGCISSLNEHSTAYEGRLNFCKRLGHLDEMIGRLVSSLKINLLWDKTILMLTSDNGGTLFNDYSYDPYTGYGNNFPYRGGRGSYFEGGLRVPLIISGGYLDDAYRNTKDDRLAHLVDIPTTMLDLAGLSIPQNFDGMSLLQPRTRSVLIYNLRPTNESSMNLDDMSLFINPIAKQSNAIQWNTYKYIHGYQYVDSWVDVDEYPVLEVSGSLPEVQPCFPSPCLFDLITDPYEKEDISDSYPEVIEDIEAFIESVTSSEDFHSGQNYNEIPIKWEDGFIHPYL